MESSIKIRSAIPPDHDAIWKIIQQVISSGDTYVFDPDSSREKMINYWCGPDKHTFVATIDEQVVGTFIIKDNQPDLGSHVANASYSLQLLVKASARRWESFHCMRQGALVIELCNLIL